MLALPPSDTHHARQQQQLSLPPLSSKAGAKAGRGGAMGGGAAGAALRYQPLLWLGITGGVESEQRRSNRDARSFETGIGFIEIEARYD